MAGLLNNRAVLSVLFMFPAASILLLFLTYPLALGIWMGFTDARIGRPGIYVGLEQYLSLFDDDVFWLSSSTRWSIRRSPPSPNSGSECGWRCCSIMPCRSRR
jgi:ABC-type sugar transport system permease subunit